MSTKRIDLQYKSLTIILIIEFSFAGTDNEQAVDNFNFRTEDLSTDLFTDKEDSGRGIITETDKEIQSRNEANIPQNTKRSTTLLHMSSWRTRVWDNWLSNRTPYYDSETFVEP